MLQAAKSPLVFDGNAEGGKVTLNEYTYQNINLTKVCQSTVNYSLYIFIIV